MNLQEKIEAQRAAKATKAARLAQLHDAASADMTGPKILDAVAIVKTVPHWVDVDMKGPFYLAGYGGGWSDAYRHGERGRTLGEAISEARRMKSKYGFHYVALKDRSGRSVWNIDMDRRP